MASSDDMRKRLDALAAGDDVERDRLRQRLARQRAQQPSAGAPEAIVFPRELKPRRTPPAVPPAFNHPYPIKTVALADAVAGEEAPCGAGKVYLIRRTVAEHAPKQASVAGTLADCLADPNSAAARTVADCGVPRALADDLVFFDLETTGLSTAPLFLIGAMVAEAGELVCYQYFCRDYSEEPAALELFLDLVRPRRLLVSFNGKSFDAPFVRTRAAACGVPGSLDLPHLDLLHVSRRHWKDRLPNCKLQTLEHRICGRLRTDDIPGHAIPDAYHRYVRTGDAREMAQAIEHNFLDLLTLADLLTRLPE